MAAIVKKSPVFRLWKSGNPKPGYRDFRLLEACFTINVDCDHDQDQRILKGFSNYYCDSENPI